MFINVSNNENEQVLIQQGFYNIARFPRVLLAIDCTHVRIQSPGRNQAEQFRNRKGYFSINVQMACDSKLKFRDVVARWPGSAHDSTIFSNSSLEAKFNAGMMGDSLMLDDSGYVVSSYLITPLLEPITAAENIFNESQIRTRNVIERSFGIWKRRFPVNSLGMRLNLETVQDVILATAILHNIAIEQNEELPEIDIDIQETFVPEMIVQENDQNDSVRRLLIQNYFARLGVFGYCFSVN